MSNAYFKNRYLDKNASMKDTRTVNIYDKNLLLKKARILQFQNGYIYVTNIVHSSLI